MITIDTLPSYLEPEETWLVSGRPSLASNTARSGLDCREETAVLIGSFGQVVFRVGRFTSTPKCTETSQDLYFSLLSIFFRTVPPTNPLSKQVGRMTQ